MSSSQTLATPRVNLEDRASVKRVTGVPYVPAPGNLHIGYRGNYVAIKRSWSNFPAFLSTKTATNIGLDLCRKMGPIEFEFIDDNERAPLPNETDLVVLTINGEDIMLLPDAARQIGGALIRKAERADEWQKRLKDLSYTAHLQLEDD